MDVDAVLGEVDHLVSVGVRRATACACVAERFTMDAELLKALHWSHVVQGAVLGVVPMIASASASEPLQ